MEIRELISIMNQNVELICKHLLPNGKRSGSEWRVGSLSNEPGDSLGVKLSGSKVGVWADFASDAKGDLLTLWKEVNNVDIVTAIKQVKDFLNIIDDNKFYNKPKPKTYVKPKPPVVTINDKAKKYLNEVRKINDTTLEVYGTCFNSKEIIFKYYKNNKLVNIKYLTYDYKGKKIIRQEKDAEPCLFGWTAIDNNLREIIITEGEIDAMTMFQYGYPALSIPGGAKNNKWIENDWNDLDRFETIYLAMDMDEPGREASVEFAKRLGLHRCRIVELPKKDINECLKSGIPQETIDKCIKNSKYILPENLANFNDFLTGIEEELSQVKGVNYYSPNFHSSFKYVRLYPAELTIFGGVNGSGKTTFLMQLALDIASQNNKVCIASLEQKPAKYLKKIVKQASDEQYPTRETIHTVSNWLNGKILIYNRVGIANNDNMIKTFEYAYKRYGVNFFIIDSLTKCGFAEDDYNGQKKFVEFLTDFVLQYNIHIILVAHSRKLLSEKKQMDKMDIKGTGAITDLAFNVYILMRNKIKEQAKDNTHINEPDVILSIQKQREFGWEGIIDFMYNKNTEKFYEDNNPPYKYI